MTKIATISSCKNVHQAVNTVTVQNTVYASLDMDDTDRRGLETTAVTSVLQQVYGTFHFYVNNYSKDLPLSESCAKVENENGLLPKSSS